MIRTCRPSATTTIHHILQVPPCCPISGNPRPGSSIRVSYRPTNGRVMPVEALAEMLAEYVGGRESVREMETMVQDFAERCAATVLVAVSVRADLIIAPPYGGAEQRMIVSCRSNQEAPA